VEPAKKISTGRLAGRVDCRLRVSCTQPAAAPCALPAALVGLVARVDIFGIHVVVVAAGGRDMVD
jgi:hypothetical protein